MPLPIFCLKIDVDTERGTREGVPNLLALFRDLTIPATFLLALGPDNTGRAIKRIFRPGFLRKVVRSNVAGVYGFKTLLNGVLWPGPHIARRHANIMRSIADAGHEVGIHCYDHIRWQDGVHKMAQAEVFKEFDKARTEFKKVFNTEALTAGAAGWQANANSLAAYDAANLLYASDSRGIAPFYPRINNQVFKTVQIPTTLPTFDELSGRPDYPENSLISYYLSLLKDDLPNIFTMHAEIEGMAKLDWFRDFLMALKKRGVNFQRMDAVAKQYLSNASLIPVHDLMQRSIEGRSGTLAVESL